MQCSARVKRERARSADVRHGLLLSAYEEGLPEVPRVPWLQTIVSHERATGSPLCLNLLQAEVVTVVALVRDGSGHSLLEHGLPPLNHPTSPPRTTGTDSLCLAPPLILRTALTPFSVISISKTSRVFRRETLLYHRDFLSRGDGEVWSASEKVRTQKNTPTRTRLPRLCETEEEPPRPPDRPRSSFETLERAQNATERERERRQVLFRVK